MEKTFASSSLTFGAVTSCGEVNVCDDWGEVDEEEQRGGGGECRPITSSTSSLLRPSPTISFSSVTSNEALVNDAKPYDDMSRSTQYRLYEALKSKILEMCILNKMSDENIISFLN